MGCTQSLIENEESVARCKERKQFMKSAVGARNAFAAAHSAYAMALKNTGAAFYDYTHGEVHDLRSTSTTLPSSSYAAANSAATAAQASPSAYPAAAVAGSAAASVQPPVDRLPPPPPPLPADLSPAAPLQRSASMPGLPISKNRRKETMNEPEIIEEDIPEVTTDDTETDTAEDSSTAHAVPPAPPKPPQPSETPAPLPPPQVANENSWYLNLFNTEHIPAPSLGQPDEAMLDREVEKFQKAGVSHDPAANESPQPASVPAVSEKGVAETLPPTHQKPGRKTRPSSGSSHHRSGSYGGGSESKRGKMPTAVPQSVSFLQILNELDDHFLKASQSAHEVSKMLEATRLHYHSDYADIRGHLDHSQKIMKIIRWNKPISDTHSEDDTKDDLDDERWETHATVLEKMLAWEKKLYDEVKAAELMKIRYQRKLSLLNKQKKKGTNPETVETIKAVVSHLHTRYIVDMQSMDSTISEINNLRDHKLYPKLVELVNGMAIMWEAMYSHHSYQHKLVTALRAFDVSFAPWETSEQHHDITIQLWQVVRDWHSKFQIFVTHQKEYIQALNSWLKLNLVPFQNSSLKEEGSSPHRSVKPPIRDLLHYWHERIEKLPDGIASRAIYSFSEVINTILILQEDELKLKEKCDETRKEFIRKKHAYEDWHHKYIERRMASTLAQETEQDHENSVNCKDHAEERKLAVESIKIRLKSEEEEYQRTCRQVRDKSLGSFRNHLPEIFSALSDFSLACSDMYKQLRLITQKSVPTGQSPSQ